MMLKDFLLDKRFSILVWLLGVMCLSVSVTTLILLGILYSTSASVIQFLDIMKSGINLTILFVITFTVILNGFIFIGFSTIGYISSPPDNSFANFEEMRNQVQKVELLTKYRISFLLLFSVFIGFCIGYLIGGNDWKVALRLSLTIITPISIAIVAASFFGIVIEIILLGVKYLLWFDSSLEI